MLGRVIPFSRLKSIDGKRLGVTIGRRLARARRAKRIALVTDRKASWERIVRLLAPHRLGFDKLPVRTRRTAKLLLFRSFKLLGAIKSHDEVSDTRRWIVPLSLLDALGGLPSDRGRAVGPQH